MRRSFHKHIAIASNKKNTGATPPKRGPVPGLSCVQLKDSAGFGFVSYFGCSAQKMF